MFLEQQAPLRTKWLLVIPIPKKKKKKREHVFIISFAVVTKYYLLVI